MKRVFIIIAVAILGIDSVGAASPFFPVSFFKRFCFEKLWKVSDSERVRKINQNLRTKFIQPFELYALMEGHSSEEVLFLSKRISKGERWSEDDYKKFEAFIKRNGNDLDPDIRERSLRWLTNWKQNSELEQIRGFARYYLEGWKTKLEEKYGLDLGSYRSSGLGVTELSDLLGIQNFKGKKGIDFGFGSAEILKSLHEQKAEVIGYDMSPYFLMRARRQGLNVMPARMDVSLENFVSEFGIEPESQDFVISTLTLDRIQNPSFFLQNFMDALKPKGSFALQTLLPVKPEDDGQVMDPITYTPFQNRITSGQSVEADRESIQKILTQYGAAGIKVQSLPYRVISRDGEQTYTLWSFSGYKSVSR